MRTCFLCDLRVIANILRFYLLAWALACLLWPSSVASVDTLTVAPQPEPLSESWRWTRIDLPGRIYDIHGDPDGTLWFATSSGAVQYDGRAYRTLTSKDGLGSDHIRSITRDRDGALWFSTQQDGITRILGDSTRTYTVDDGLSGNEISGLIQSRDGGLWARVGNLGAGVAELHYFDGRSWSLMAQEVVGASGLIENTDGELWLSTFGQGIWRYRDGEWYPFGPDENLYGSRFLGLWQSSQGSTWSTLFNESEEPSIVRYKDGRWNTYGADMVRPGSGVFSFWETEDRPIHALDAQGNVFAFEKEKWRPVETARKYASKYGNVAFQVSDDVIWFYPNNTAYFADRIRLDESMRQRFVVGRELRGGGRDNGGSIWFVTDEGPVRFDGSDWLLYGQADGLLAAPYDGMLAAHDGSVWFSARDGLCRFVEGRWEIHPFETIGLDRITVPGRSEGMLDNVQDGSFWAFGSREGRAHASRYDGRTWQILDPGFDIERISSGFAAASGDIWFATTPWESPTQSEGEGVVRYVPGSDPDQAAWTRYTVEDGLLHNRVYDFGQSSDGTIWAGTLGGLSGFDGTGWSRHRGDLTKAAQFRALDDGLWCIHYTPEEAGVSHYDGKTWRSFNRHDGFEADRARNILAGKDGTVWVAGEQAISRYRPDSDTWSNYTDEDGISPGIIDRLWESREGIGYTARDGSAGIVIPDGDAPVTSLAVAPGEIGSTGNIHLVWSGRDYWDVTPQVKLRFQYRMDGQAWSPWTDRTAVTFTSLSTGSHRFELRAIDDENNIEATPVVHAFVVEAPWWLNPFAVGPGLLLVFAVACQTARVVRGKRSLEVANDALSDANNDLFQANVDLQREQVLERLRGQAQGMQSSEDIGPLLEVVYRELKELGLPMIQSSIDVMISDTEKEEWTTAEDGSALAPVVVPRPASTNPGLSAYQRGDDYMHHHFESEGRTEEIRRVIDEGVGSRSTDLDLGRIFGNPRWKGVSEERWPNEADCYTIFFDGGYVSLVTKEPVHEDYLMLIKRFGEVFGFAHSRYRELREKEAQNRRLAVDASVQRLRAEVQSMDEVSDFEHILSLLTEGLKTVALSFEGCEIDVLNDPVERPRMDHFVKHGFQYTTYKLDTNGKVTPSSYALNAPFPSVNERTIERFIAGEPYQGSSDGEAILEVPAGSYGRLRVTSTEREGFEEDEVRTLREFADAVALGYARYLDIRAIQVATERKSAFLASMSHELRTPMNAIKGFTNLVLRRGKDELSERNQENLQKVSHASDHLLTMINDLLDLSKIEAGRMEVNASTFSVKELIASACDTVSPLVPPGVELQQDVATDIGEANTDMARVQQMVINLLSNAIKFTEAGEVKVSAECKMQNAEFKSEGDSRSDSSELVISVRDTGKGIPADELPTLFDEYRQVKGGSESEVQKGTGLGLSITKKFAELLGGSIEVESEVGKGSVFTVRIPAEYS